VNDTHHAFGDYSKVLIEQNERFAALVADADPETPVPACPGWSLGQLCRHVGRGDRWAGQIVGDRMDAPLNPRDVRGGKPPEDPAGLLPWLHGSSRQLLDAVAATGPEVPVWTFLGPRPAGWWIRRRLHEWTVHRADAALALGVGFDLEPALAADGLSEWLGLLAGGMARGAPDGPPLEPGRTLHLHATDDGLGSAGEWLIQAADDGQLTWENAHLKADTAVRGPALDLLLVLLRRRPVSTEGVQVFGDEELLATWLGRTGF
jgi:uncharacterized protein (TIGR03083 family)